MMNIIINIKKEVHELLSQNWAYGLFLNNEKQASLKY